ncbi:MAG TPA: aspartyl protease family protein [Steroidobacteraceae bacterium]|jgi:predicted aspartyl protease
MSIQTQAVLAALCWLSGLSIALAVPAATEPQTPPPPTAVPDLPVSPSTVPQAPIPGTTSPQTLPVLQKPPAQGAGTQETPSEVVVDAPEPKYVAPTLRDRIGRIWAPVLINGKGPFRLVLDTGASHSAIIQSVVESLGLTGQAVTPIMVRGVTGSAIVNAIHVDSMEVGDLLIDPATLPIVADVFGGADGVLGREGLPDKRIFADFRHDKLIIARSHLERPPAGYTPIHLKLTRAGLLEAEVRVGSVRTEAIIDTGGQQTVGNVALRDALMKREPPNARPEDIVGVTLDLQRGDTIAAPPISIGTLRIQHVSVTFADTFLFEHLQLTRKPTLLLGMDVLGSFDAIIIDYRMRELEILTRNGPEF